MGPMTQNITLAIDQRLLKRARSFAAGQGNWRQRHAGE
jgi:hypothetical protein